jgi:acyl-coenzyme A synthetase/AMP-(fatty) acid ligase
MLDEAQRALPRDLSSLAGIVTMGSPLEREACIRYQRVLCPNIFNGYGTTEAFWNTLLRPVDLPEHAGSAGRSCIDDDVRVVRIYEDRFAAPDDVVAQNGVEIGEVIVRSPLKCPSRYVDDPEREAAVFRAGWVYIGDLGTWDDQEYVTIVGRKDDMLLSGGENVHPVQVEDVLCQHPLVVDALVTGAPEPTWGEVVVAYVVARDPSLTAAELDRHCVEHPMLARYKRPRGYRFVEALPLTATGKKRHFVMKNQAREDIARDAFVRI